MEEKLKLMSDSELIDLAKELNSENFHEDSITRKIVESETNLQFMMGVLMLHGKLAQVLAERLKACSPHIVK